MKLNNYESERIELRNKLKAADNIIGFVSLKNKTEEEHLDFDFLLSRNEHNKGLFTYIFLMENVEVPPIFVTLNSVEQVAICSCNCSQDLV